LETLGGHRHFEAHSLNARNEMENSTRIAADFRTRFNDDPRVSLANFTRRVSQRTISSDEEIRGKMKVAPSPVAAKETQSPSKRVSSLKFCAVSPDKLVKWPPARTPFSQVYKSAFQSSSLEKSPR